VLTCELLVPIQAGAWLLLMIINGVVIQNAVLILLLIGTLTALHYRE